MKIKFKILVFVLCMNAFASSQTVTIPQTTCFYYETESKGVTTALGFSSTNEAERIIQAIIDVIGLKPNFSVNVADVPNAAAVILKGKRYILYNRNFIERMDKISGTRWSSISILAHEIGHHLNGHTLSSSGSRPAIELEADEFSGFVLKKMGATLDESQAAMKIAASVKSSHTHPARNERLQSIARGWKKADAQMKGERHVDIDKLKTPDTNMKLEPAERQNALERKYILFEVNFNFDPGGNYFVTIRNNLVKINEDGLEVYGRLVKTESIMYPYVLYNSEKSYLFVTGSGVIVSKDGKRAGYLKRIS